jgi:AcrR family transcriptional regulator
MVKKSKPQKKRTRNPVETRAKLLQATIELVSEKGAEALSLKEAANRANVSRGVAYLHFEDREQLLLEAKTWISEGLQTAVLQFRENTSLHDRTFHTTKLVLTHPEASKLLITAAMAGTDLDREHPLYKLVANLLRELKASGRARADVDVEIMTYIMFGSIAATVILGAQRKGDDLDWLSERFANEWDRVMEKGIFAPNFHLDGEPRKSKRAPRAARK